MNVTESIKMYEEYEETKIVKKRRKFCDICEKEISIGLACSKANCIMCRRDLCESCIGHEVETGGDYRIVYCKSCWDSGEKTRSQVDELTNKIDELHTKWKDICFIKIDMEKSGRPLSHYCIWSYGNDELLTDCACELGVFNESKCNFDCKNFKPRHYCEDEKVFM